MRRSGQHNVSARLKYTLPLRFSSFLRPLSPRSTPSPRERSLREKQRTQQSKSQSLQRYASLHVMPHRSQ